MKSTAIPAALYGVRATPLAAHAYGPRTIRANANGSGACYAIGCSLAAHRPHGHTARSSHVHPTSFHRPWANRRAAWETPCLIWLPHGLHTRRQTGPAALEGETV